jgi:hypothetical protein
MVRSNTKTWLAQTKFAPERPEGKREITHVFMDGGKVHISPEDIPEFFERYAKDVWNNKMTPNNPCFWNYICELHTDTFNFYADLDILDTELFTYERVMTLAKNIQNAIYPFIKATHSSSEAKVVVCMSQSYEKGDLMKTGVHMIWPGVRVESCDALFLREVIVQYLDKEVGKRPAGVNPWSDVVDEAVYGNGKSLRMIGSYKSDRCKCKGHDCMICGGSKRIPKARTYDPTIVLDGNGNELKTLTANVKNINKLTETLQLVTIRTNEMSNVDLVKPYPKWFTFNVDKFKSNCRGRRPNKKHSTVMRGIKQNSRFKGDDVELSDEIIKKLSKQIQRAMQCPEYKNLGIRSVKKSANDMFTIITNSHYCQNLGRNHNSEHVYFQIRGKKIVQKCFCKCDTSEGREKGKCKYYSSSPQHFPGRLISILKGDKSTDPKKSGFGSIKNARMKQAKVNGKMKNIRPQKLQNMINTMHLLFDKSKTKC